MPAEARLIAGRYRLGSVLGRGGMGAVWHGHDETLDRPVAVKEVRFPEGIPGHERDLMRERTMREARLTARLSHPGIVTIYDVVSDDGRPYIVMELVAGHSLAEDIDRHGALAPQRVAVIGLQVLDALAVAHREGIVHRDVKPSNVLLAADGRIILSDFGIAVSDSDANLTSTGLLVGSPAYMSPERLRGEGIGAAADLWSLGATLYAALQAEPPFRATTSMGTITAVLADDVVPPGVEGPLREALLGMLVKSPQARLSQAQVRSLLQQAVAEGEESARPVEPESDSTTVHLLPAAPVMAATAAPSSAPEEVEDRPRRHSATLPLLVGFALLAVAGVVFLAFTQLGPGDDPAGEQPQDSGQGPEADSTTDGGTPSPSPDTPLSAPQPFASAELYAFVRGLFDPAECERSRPGERPVLDRNPDVEAVSCEGPAYGVNLFRKDNPDELAAERQLYLSKAQPGSVTPIPVPPAGPAEQFDGRRFGFIPEDGGARVYWDSVSCMCGGIIRAPDDDVAAAIDFWQGE